MVKYARIKLTSPKQRYLSDLKKEGFSYDPSQDIAVDLLDSLYNRLIQDEEISSRKEVLECINNFLSN
jgi:predicted ATPase